MDMGIKHYLRSSVVTHCHESVLVTMAVVTCHYRLIQTKAPFCPAVCKSWLQCLGQQGWPSASSRAASSSLPMPAFLPGSRKLKDREIFTRFRAGFVLGTSPVLSAG